MKKTIFFIFFLCFVCDAIAQTFVMLHIDNVRLRIRGGTLVDRWYLGSQGEWDPGAGIGLDVRHHFKKFYVQIGFTHSENMPRLFFVNTNPQKIADPDNPTSNLYFEESINGVASERFLRLSMPIMIGTTLKKYGKRTTLRMFGGIMPVYRFSYLGQGKDWDGDTQSKWYPLMREFVIVGKLVNMYQPFELHASIGAGIDIGKFTIDVRRSVALTDLAHDIQFEGKTYPFRWTADQLNIALGWKFRVDKNRPRKHKKNTYF